MSTDTAWLGIDIGASSTKLALQDAGTAAPTALGQTVRYDHPTLEQLAAAVRGAAEVLLDQAGPVGVAGVGLAVPGPVDDGGVVVQCGNLPALDGVDSAGWLRGVLRGAMEEGVPVYVSTDANAAAAGAWSADPKRGRTLYLSLGTGVGGAVLDDGVPLTFTRGTPGHLGHLDISGGDADAPATQAAGRGAAEAYLGAPALRAAGLPIENPAACADHPAMDEVLSALARTLRIALALYRMDHVVLLGGVAPIFAPHLGTIKTRVADGLTTVAPDTWTLGVGETGLHTAAIGAVRLALEHSK